MNRRLFSIFLAVAVLVMCNFGYAQPRQMPPRTTQVYIEDSPAARELLDQAARLARQQRLTDAVATYQQVIEQYSRKLILTASVETGQKVYQDAADYVRTHLTADPNLLATYRKTFGPAARHAFEQATARALNPRDLDHLMTTWYLTDAAWDAAALLAGYYLEQGRPQSASAVLDQIAFHPLTTERPIRWHFLQAGAAVFADQTESLNRHRSALENLGAMDELAAIDRWKNNLDLPARRPGHGDAGQTVSIPDTLGPLWELPIASISVVSNGKIAEFENKATVKRDPLFSIRPTIHEQRLYVNDNWSVWALDRLSGRKIWRYEFLRDQVIVNPMQAGRRQVFQRTAYDTRSVVLTADYPRRLFTVLGISSRQTTRQVVAIGEAAPEAVLICLDSETGQPIWQVSPHDIDTSMEAAHFHGSPHVVQGLVLATILRRHASGFHDAFLVAVDAENGQLVWKRYLASMASSYRGMLRPGARLMVHGDRLYVTTHLGAAACLDVRSGYAHWITILPKTEFAAQRAIAQKAIENWRVAGPILIQAGLVIPPATQDEIALLLDPDSGYVTRRLDDEPFRKPYRVEACYGDLLLIGPTLRLLDGETLELKWRTPVQSDTPVNAVAHTTMVGDAIYVTTNQQLVAYDLHTGKINRAWPIDAAGNLTLANGQVVVAGEYTLRSFMQWQMAYRTMQKQMADAPLDPNPGLAMAHAGLRAEQSSAVLEGIDHTLNALRGREPVGVIDPDDPLQPLVFNALMQFAQPRQAIASQLVDDIFERIANAASSLNDEARYHLAYGRFLAQTGRPGPAVEHLQTILLDSQLAEQQIVVDDYTRNAGIEATANLNRLIEQDGQGVYARYEQIAFAAFNQLKQADSTDVSGLLELAARYPVARASSAALLFAAEIATRRDRLIEALTYLRQAYQRPADNATRQQIVGLMVHLYDQSGQPRRAGQWLLRAKRDYPAITPMRDGQMVDIDQWLTELASRPESQARRPNFTTSLGKPDILPGRLLVPSATPHDQRSHDMFVTFDDRIMRLYTTDQSNERWQLSFDHPNLELLALSSEQVLVHQKETNTIVAIDAVTGKPAWQAIDVGRQLQAVPDFAVGDGKELNQDEFEIRIEQGRLPQDAMQRLQNANPRIFINNGRRIRFTNNTINGNAKVIRTFVAVNDMVITVADFMGRVVTFDRQTGQVLWRLSCPVRQLQWVEMNGQCLALVGVIQRAPDDRAVHGCVMLLDPVTGDENTPAIYTDVPVQWFTFAGAERFIYSTGETFTARHAADGSLQWQRPQHGQRPIKIPLANDDLIVVLDNSGLVMIDAATGQTQNHLAVGFSLAQTRPRIQQADGQLHILSPDQAVCVEPGGHVRWRDCVSGYARHFINQMIGRDYIALVNDLNPQMIENPRNPKPWQGHHNYFIHLLDRNTGQLLDEYALGPMHTPILPHNALVLNNALILCSIEGTVRINTHD